MAQTNSPSPFFSTFSRASLSLLLLLHVAFATPPLVDFDRMGKVGIAGSFSGFTFLDSSSNTATLDPSTSTLLSRSTNGDISQIGSTNPGGNIFAGCTIDDTFYFAGSFSSIGGTPANNVASYKSSSGAVAAVGPNGPNGEVRALYCDASQKKVWAGGSFTSPARSVAVLDVASSSWSAPPFGGLSGSNAEVSSITTNSSHSSIFFAGSFVTSFGNSSIVINGTNNPNVPFSSGATPFSSSLVPVPLQNAQIDASPSTTESGFDNVSNILCPAGEDGPGNTWFARDGSSPIITVRKFSFLSASGIRIGNTFLDGRGTTAFSITTIPDNTVQTLRYTDPEDGNNKTCSNNCPLLTDPSVPYQDFLFNQAADITGFQLTLTEWKGDGPGLHLLQLLSSGASASAIEADNGVSCFAPNPSNSSQTGNWIEKVANTDIPGTIQAVLVSEVNVGTPSSQGPTFTWMPYLSASGQYDINLLVPGCTDFQDCALRTSVKVTVFPGDGLDPIIRTISQRNTENAFVSIYSGPIVPTSQTFVATITMALADNPEGSGQNGKYEIVADRVQLILTSANVTGNGSVGTPSSSAASQRGFGFFEWPLSSSGNVNASGILPNSSVTTLDTVGFEMFTALGGASATDSISAVAHHDSGVIFLAGDFNLSAGPASGASNIVAFKDGALTQLSNRGLNGPVTSLVVDGDALFIGGSFTDTASASTNGALSGVAIYDVKNNQWRAMEGGVNGVVFGLSLANDEVTVVGNFSSPMVAQNKPLSSSASSFASWDVNSGNWSDTTGLIMGNLTFVTNNTSNGDFMAGHISASYEFGASGFALLQNNGDDGIPHVTALNLPLGLPSTTSVPTVSRRYHIRRTAAAILPRIGQFFKRQSPSTTSLTPLPTTQPISAPAILAGAFWTNSSSNADVAIVGGNFTFTSASGQAAQDLAVYELDSGVVSALKGNQVNGSIHSLLVQGNLLFVGGTFTVEGTNQVGFAVYDLAEEQWDVTGVQPLQSGSNALVTVRSITASPSQSNVLIVAGSFASAGSTTCRAICSFDFSSKQWSALGSGIQGEVASVAYAGNTRDIVIASGSIALADSTLTNVAMYTIGNSTWSAIGDSNSLPGPVTALEVNNGNSSSIFAAGKASDGSSTYFSYWDGHTWNSIGSGLTAATDVSQLIMVPLQNTHEANGVVEPDRMLMVSGSLSDSSFGNASSVLFDGRQFIPYILSASTTGAPGAISSLIHSISQFSFNQRHFLATGVVILVSIAIAAGVVFLLALIGILWTLFSRRDDKINKFDPAEAEEDDSLHRPSSLLEHINAATRTTIFGGHDPFNSDTAEKEVGAAALASASSDHDPFGPDGSNYIRAETPSDAIMGMAGEEVGRAAHARYSFNGEGEGELRLVGGQEIEVLDDRDPAWWYARDPRSGQEGVVPAAYVY